MASAPLILELYRAQGRRIPRLRSGAGLDRHLVALGAALAISGLAEVLLQRIVYRLGIHIPHSGLATEAYSVATASGDFAFRTTAVLLIMVAALAVVWLSRAGDSVGAVLLAALVGANALAWPLGAEAGARAAPFVFAIGAAWVAGRALTAGGDQLLRWGALAAALSFAASQCVIGLSGLGEASPVASVQLLSEAGLIAAAMVVGLAAVRSAPGLMALAGSTVAVGLMAAAYGRDPSTVAILSLWATGITLSLPPALYIGAFGAALYAILAWAPRPETRHLAIGLALLLVAGLQPQALHHGITALLGLTFVAMGRPSTADGTQAEVFDGF